MNKLAKFVFAAAAMTLLTAQAARAESKWLGTTVFNSTVGCTGG